MLTQILFGDLGAGIEKGISFEVSKGEAGEKNVLRDARSRKQAITGRWMASTVSLLLLEVFMQYVSVSLGCQRISHIHEAFSILDIHPAVRD